MAILVPDMTDLLSRGYFAKELPPAFSTASLAKYAEPQFKSLAAELGGQDVTRSAAYSLTRPGGVRRALAIPNPFAYVRLCDDLLSNWSEIDRIVGQSQLAESKPMVATSGRAIKTTADVSTLVDIRLRYRAEFPVLLRADVSDFYQSIYTHSVPWALMGKQVAKGRRTKGLANRLDQALQKCRDGQTKGIDVGPDASFVIAELLLGACDKQLLATSRDLRGFRYYDDYELYFDSEGDAERALEALESALAELELSLSPTKTEIVRLPQPIEYGWALELRRVQMDMHAGGQVEVLVDLFERAFELVRRGVHAHVMGYTLGLTRSMQVDARVWKTYEHLMWQSTFVESSLLPAVLSEVLRYAGEGHQAVTIDRKLARRVLNKHVVRHAGRGNTHEVAWAIWGLISLRQNVVRAAKNAACSMNDPIVAILMLEAHSRGHAGKALDSGRWEHASQAESLMGPFWILAYEAGVRGWKLGPSAPGSKWRTCFGDMRDARVTFLSGSFEFKEECFRGVTDKYWSEADDTDERSCLAF